jgi:aryl-alcohol dehydrogenase-like predicted oxidoreductase
VIITQTKSQLNKLLNAAVDLGINLFDTARGYGASEERIGKFLSHRRNEIILSTKVGYSIPGYKDWTYDCVIAGINEALKQLHVLIILILFIFIHVLRMILMNNGVIDALEKAREEGKIKVVAYSGENEHLSLCYRIRKVWKHADFNKYCRSEES